MKKYIYCIGIIIMGLLSSCKFERDSKVPSFVMVNILDKRFYDDCHIIGSINVPFTQIKDYALKYWDKAKTEIVLYCGNYKCTSSGMAAKQLKELGFEKVWAYEGGTAEAMTLNLVEGPCTENYLQDLEKPEHVDESIPVISGQELKKKIEQYAKV